MEIGGRVRRLLLILVVDQLRLLKSVVRQTVYPYVTIVMNQNSCCWQSLADCILGSRLFGICRV